MTTTTDLRSALEALAADPEARKPRSWKRPANEIVMAEYREFVATGEYPYLDAVVAQIATKHGIGEAPFHHQAIHDRGDALLIALHTEVYIASGQHRVEKMEQQERELAEAGWLPITELVPAEGMRIKLPDGKTYRLAPCQGATVPGGREADWALLPPRKRTHGVSLNGLVRQHRAYMESVELRQTEMNDPAVRMFKVAS